ncbi:hypothetical protein B0H19DRAFT_1257400 [Mycena capillaripes]|nr:hypothetical protein B0H19DRAFT_1257400 [Mycena capillaripes]
MDPPFAVTCLLRLLSTSRFTGTRPLLVYRPGHLPHPRCSLTQRVVAISALLLLLTVTLGAAQDPPQFVNPLIATKTTGTFLRAQLYLVKACLHQPGDGNGGGYSFGKFPFLLLTTAECADDDLAKCSLDRSLRAFEHGLPTASPGYFAIPLNNGVNAEMTITQHTALYRLTPPTDLGKSFHGGKVTFTLSPTARGKMRITGSSAFILSLGQEDYRVYFCFEDLGPIPAGGGLVQAALYQAGKYTPLDVTGTFEKELRAQWNAILPTVDVDATSVSAATQELF